MKGYKAFKKGLVCRDKQYAENTVFEEDKAEVCRSGMHFCKNPLDVFKFYDLVDEHGNYSRLAISGDCSQFATSGYNSRLASNGNYSRLVSSGDNSLIESTGKNSVICCAGNGSKAKAKIGSWITLSEWNWNEKNEYVPICVKTMYVDGEIIKEDTFYKLKDGEFTEAE